MQLNDMRGWSIESQNLIGTDLYTKETYNGGIEEFTFNFNIFQRNGTFIQPDATKISRWTWNFTMEEYAAKPIDFSFLDARQAKKNGGSIAKEFELKLTSLLNAYRDICIPNMIKYTLFNVPLAGGEYQTQSVPTIGLLRDTTVIPERLQLADTTGTVPAGQPHSVIRNHYRAITNPSTPSKNPNLNIYIFKNLYIGFRNAW